MYETYPKSGAPRMLGEQKSATFAKASGSVKSEYRQTGSKDRYPAKGHVGPTSRLSSHEKARAPFAKAGGNKMVTASYPAKTHANFGTEKAKNTLVAPMSRQPKQA